MTGKRWDGGVDGELPAIHKHLTQEKISAFESCSAMMLDKGSGVENIHTDAEMARRAGLESPVASGMMSTAFLNEMLTVAFGDAWLHGGHLSVAFIGSLRAHDDVAVRGTVRNRTQEGGRVRLELDVWCENGRGEKVTVGTADLLVDGQEAAASST